MSNLGLQTLFIYLRAAGIPVGLEEIRRLGTAFALMPAVDADGLRCMIAAVVVKSARERKVFDRAFDQWMERAERDFEEFASDREPRERKRKRAKQLSGPRASPVDVIALPGPVAEPSAARPVAQRAKSALESAPAAPQQQVAIPEPEPNVGPGATPGLDPPLRDTPPASGPSGGEDEGVTGLPSTPRRPAPGPESTASLQSRNIAGGLIAAAVIALAVAVWILFPRGDGAREPDAGVAEIQDAGATGPDVGPEARLTAILVPQLEVTQQLRPSANWLGIILPLLTLIVCVSLWSIYGSGRWLPRAAANPPPAYRGPPGPPRRGSVQTLFLNERDQETLIWGVGRFVSEDRSDDLDVTRTVDQTAAAFGRPVLEYEARRYQREVWLWIDESIDSPAARHLARDLCAMLRQSGLPVTRARFWGIPDRLRAENGEVLIVDELDARRDTVAVAVLTDGRLLTAAERSRTRRGLAHATLRSLSHWPRVTFIDFGRDDDRLAALLARHGLTAIQPEDAPAAISDLATRSVRQSYARLTGDARVWAAACALSPMPVDDRTALALRRRLGLGVSPWVIETLRETADSDAGGMTWSRARRAELLSWLVAVEELPDDGALPEGSLLARAAAGWQQICDERERVGRREVDGWEGSAAHELLLIERALVDLWRDPVTATRALYTMYRGGAGQRIRRHLAALMPAERAGEAHATAMPWRLARLPREIQLMLRTMGFGCAAPVSSPDSLPRPGRLWLALGLGAGLGLGATASIVYDYLTADRPPPTLAPDVDKRKASVDIKRVGGVSVAVAETPWSGDQRRVEAGELVRVRWEEETKPCRDTSQPGVRIDRCPERKVQPPADRWSFAILDVSPGSLYFEGLSDKLAWLLLDSGSVDAVYRVSGPASYPDLTELAVDDDDQLLIVARANAIPNLAGYRGAAVVIDRAQVGKLVNYWAFDGARSLVDWFGDRLPVLEGDPAEFLIRGFGRCGGLAQPCCPEDAIGRESFDSRCDDALVCGDDERCVPAARDVCAAGERRCQRDGDGAYVQVCRDDGSGWRREQPCASGVCEDGACLQTICEPGAARCADPTTRQTCDDRGVQWVDRRCPRDQFCVGDRCRALACRPGERRCKDRSTLVVCSALGVPSEQRCACQNGACKPEFSVEVTFVELSVTLAQDKGGPPTKDPRIVKAEVACEVDGKAALKRGFPLREGTVKLGTSASFDMAKRARFTLTCRLEAKGAVPGKPYRAAHTIQALGTRTRWLSLRLLSNRLNAPVATANLAYQLRVVRNR